MNQTTQYKIIDIAIITMVWLLAVLIVNPLGDFPLNDDWAYATDVKNLLETGSFTPVGWTSMSLLTHVLWGALWGAIFGFSFQVLHFSTLFISLICLWNVYLIVRELGAARFLALLVALTLGFNPIYFALSFTFMTEISFMAFVSFAVLFFIRYLRSDSLKSLLLATLFCIIATLSRQTGLFLPLAFIFAFLWKKYTSLLTPRLSPLIPFTSHHSRLASPISRLSSHLSRLSSHLSHLTFHVSHLTSLISRLTSHLSPLLSFILPFAALKLFEYYMFSTGKIQALYGLQVDELKYLLLNVPEILPLRVIKNTYQASLYVGLMGLPIWIFLSYLQVIKHRKSGGSKPTAFAMMFLPVLFLFGIITNDSQMPTLVGILETSGIGPRTLYDVYTLQISTDNLPHSFWQIVTYASALGAGLMWSLILSPIYILFFGKEKTKKTKWQTFSKSLSPSAILLLMSVAIYFAPFALVGFYDRYLLPLMMVVPLGVIALYRREYRTDDFSRRVSTPQPPPKGETDASRFLQREESPSQQRGRDASRFSQSEKYLSAEEKRYANSFLQSKKSPPLEGAGGRKKRANIFKTSAISTAVLALILMAIFSIVSTHDYLTWNQTRWEALHHLMEKENISTTNIDGGFEFGGWYNFHEIEVEIDTKKSWWWVTNDEYILTFSELPGYDIHAKYSYHSWMQGEQHVFVLKEFCPQK